MTILRESFGRALRNNCSESCTRLISKKGCKVVILLRCCAGRKKFRVIFMSAFLEGLFVNCLLNNRDNELDNFIIYWIYIRPEYNFCKARKDCPVETTLLRTRWISDQTLNKTSFLKKIRTSKVCVAVKTIWSYSILI